MLILWDLVSYPLSLCTWLQHVERALETPRCVAGRRRQQAPPPTWRPSGIAQGSRHGGGITRWLRRASSIQVTPCMWAVQRDYRQRGEAGAADNGTQCPLALGQRGPKASVQRGAPHAPARWSTRTVPENAPLAWRQVKSCTAK